MAEAAVSYLLEKTDDWLTKELSLPENIKKGINKLKSELTMMRAFLKDMDARRKQGNQVQAWIQQLRDVAYEIDVVLDMFAYQNAQQNAPWYARSRMRSHSIVTSIQEIETNLKIITEIKEKYPTDFSSHPASTSSDHDEAGIAPLYTPEVEIVGVEEPREELACWVLDVEKAYKVMFVVGMGGSGKTALVKLVYERLKTDFDCHVWLSASKSEQGQEVLSTMFNKLCNQRGQSPSISSHTLADLIDMLNNYLRDKRYLIVLDDLWNRKVWESVIYAFPRDNRSRVIITTRRGDIASSCRDNFVDVYKVQALPVEKARELFYKRAFPQSGMYQSAAGLLVSSEKLLRECEGLPLGIIEIGKLLSNREKSEFELKKLHDSLQAELASGQLSSITRALLLSYNELPYHLKFCFLYMIMFPEYCSVKRRMLIRLWIAEGFIKGVNGKKLEDVGEEYLKELVERNLIQASELDFDGRPRTCRVHNIMHKIALSISEAENFCTVRKNLRGDISGKTRRISIQNTEFNMPNKVTCHACTLFTSSIGLKIPQRISSSLKLLKILHLEGAHVDTFPSGLHKLLLLKYLCLSNTRIKLIPVKIGRLQFLETLNLKQTFVTELPNTMANLEKLRHLLVCRYIHNRNADFDAVQGFKVLTEISGLTNLQKLSFVKADRDHKLIHQLQRLTELRKLGIVDLPSNSGQRLCETIQKLRNLHTLNMASLHRNEDLKIQEISNPPTCLQRLYLKGHLEKMPQWISKLHDLVRIRLKWSRLTHDNNPITILGKLPNLLELQLLDAFTGEQLDFNTGTFLKLKILELEQMGMLKIIKIDDGALPCLQKLIISQCWMLRQISVGIVNITQLKELHLSDLPPDFVDSLRRPPTCLQHLYLKGHLEKMPQWISKLHDLVRIRLKGSRLRHDNNPITILGKLPNLLELQLLDAFTGEQLDFNPGTFLKLKILELEQMGMLKIIIIDNGALPCLQKLIISQCRKLGQIPVGIDNITQLKELYLSDLPPDFVDSLRRNGRMRHLVQHIQKIYSRDLQNGRQGAWEDLS